MVNEFDSNKLIDLHINEFDNKEVKDTNKYVLVLGAHSDDQVFGCAGTILNLQSQGYTIITLIFTHGELSHPWLKKEKLSKVRIKESNIAAKILKIKKTIFFNLPEDKILDSYLASFKIQEKLLKILEKYNPKIIFTHNDEDTHPGHRDVYNITKFVYEQMKEKYNEFNPEIYTYDIWTIVNFKKKNRTWVYFDISKHFNKKIKALSTFKTQIPTLILLWIPTFIRAFSFGVQSKYRYAEKFSKISFD